MFSRLRSISPKQYAERNVKNIGIYKYYPGYSINFVHSLLTDVNNGSDSIVFDPWNGSGITTLAANMCGYDSIGFDLNPAMLVIARARLVRPVDFSSLYPIACDILSKFKKSDILFNVSSDPLNIWSTPKSVNYIRQLDSSIQKLLVDEDVYSPLCLREDYGLISPLASFFYSCLFRVVRRLFEPFLSSNPTWFKRPRLESHKISPSKKLLCQIFKEESEFMIASIEQSTHDDIISNAKVRLGVSSSTKIPLENRSVNMVVTSPPYCTRIDYAVATAPELCVLGVAGDAYDSLRRRLIGTTTVEKGELDILDGFGKTCAEFLLRVHSHRSKASSSYYFKNHVQYFRSMQKSIAEIARVLSDGGGCVMVAQDSYYKDIHNDLPKIIVEMAEIQGLSLELKHDFFSKQTMATINTKVQRNMRVNDPIESVMCFTKN